MDPAWLAAPAECVALVAVPLIVQRWRWRTEDRRVAAEQSARFVEFCDWVTSASLEELDEWQARRHAREQAKREAIGRDRPDGVSGV